ncbi:hypothetical protein [Candidatus Chloroploca sp. Khr17]|uniref:hypothetical protein n=1 Tax=Candidatus Chloroploca sp. Khr17 TaxID=2496869 RepID=UPI00101D49CC|nr:hypothetical protein [Candidatus Chloroploca sp. Khr17]
MITTVTTTTVTTVTTITSVAVASLTLIVILTLLVLLIQKEIIGGFTGIRAQRLSKALNVAIMPLSVVFITSMLLRVLEVLR